MKIFVRLVMLALAVGVIYIALSPPQVILNSVISRPESDTQTDSPLHQSPGGEWNVELSGLSFVYQSSPIEQLRITIGDRIIFQNQDETVHSLYSSSATQPFDLGPADPGAMQSVAFTKAGTVVVECAIHPAMILQVIIEDR